MTILNKKDKVYPSCSLYNQTNGNYYESSILDNFSFYDNEEIVIHEERRRLL